MSDKRYLGNIITPTPTVPADNLESTPAPGVWSLQEAFTYTKAGLWPTAGIIAQFAIIAQDTGGTFFADRFNVATTGNTAGFGTLTSSPTRSAHAQSTTRAIFMGGGGGGALNSITFITYTTSGAGSDFGDLTQIANEKPAGASSSTRSVRAGGGDAGGSTTVVYNIIDYITSATAGNAIDFGDLLEAKGATGGCSSSTRMLAMGGFVPPFSGTSQRNTIEFITIASLGNGADFGDLSVSINNTGACASETRGVAGGGFNFGNVIEFVTIASTGNATDFGDLAVGMSNRPDACSGTTRGVFNGGATLNFITIATTGNAADFGDISADADGSGATMACRSTPAVQ